jgi:hypothetical protein
MTTFKLMSIAAAVTLAALAGCAQQPTTTASAQAKLPTAQDCGKGMPMPMAMAASMPMQGGMGGQGADGQMGGPMPMAMSEGCPADAKAKPELRHDHNKFHKNNY